MTHRDTVPSAGLADVRVSDVHLVFTLRRWLDGGPDPSVDSRHDWSVDILADLTGDDDDEVRIGHASAATYALDGDPRNAADELSDDALCCIDAILGEHDQLREDLDLDVMRSRILHVDRIWLDPAVRGRGLGLLVLRTCVDTLALDCAAVIIHPAPTEPEEMDEPGREKARVQLYEYWQQAQFQPLPDDNIHLYLDPGLERFGATLPRDEWHPRR